MSKINNKNLISYSLLAFCLSFIGLPIYIYLPNYYADNFAVGLKTMAIILLVTRLVDTYPRSNIWDSERQITSFKKENNMLFLPLAWYFIFIAILPP